MALLFTAYCIRCTSVVSAAPNIAFVIGLRSSIFHSQNVLCMFSS